MIQNVTSPCVRKRRCKYHANGCPEIFTRDNKKHGWWRYHKHVMPGKCDFEIGLEPPPLERDTKEVKMVWLTNLRVILLLYEPSRKRKQKVLWNVLHFYLVFHIYESQPKRKRRKGKGTSLRVKIEPTEQNTPPTKKVIFILRMCLHVSVSRKS